MLHVLQVVWTDPEALRRAAQADELRHYGETYRVKGMLDAAFVDAAGTTLAFRRVHQQRVLGALRTIALAFEARKRLGRTYDVPRGRLALPLTRKAFPARIDDQDRELLARWFLISGVTT